MNSNSRMNAPTTQPPVQHLIHHAGQTYSVWEWPAPPEALPILALHGFGGAALEWGLFAHPPPGSPWEHGLDRCHRPLAWWALDLPGHGDSSPPDPDDSHPLERFQAALKMVISQLLPTKPILLGYSMGGRLTLPGYVQNRLPALALMTIGSGIGIESKEERQMRWKSDQQWARRFTTEPLHKVFTAWDEQPILRSRYRASNVFKEMSAEIRQKANGPFLARSMLCYSQGRLPPLPKTLPEATGRLLLTNGVLDHKYLHINALLKSKRQLTTHCQIARAGHSAHQERPETCLEIVRALVNAY